MTVLVHMAVGAATGTLLAGRGAAFLAGVVGHVPLDLIPHYEFEKMWVEAAVAAAFFGGLIAAGFGGSGVFWGALGAVLPDLENLLWRVGVLPERAKVFPGHSGRYKRFLRHGAQLGVEHAWWQAAIAAGAALVVARHLAMN